MIIDQVLKLHDLILCYHEPIYNKVKLESLEVSINHLLHLNNMKVILALSTLNYVYCDSFSCIDSFHVAHNQPTK